MARIPNVTSIQRVVPAGSQQVATYDTRNADMGLSELAGTAKQIADDRTRYQLAKAEADFVTAKTELDNAFDQDDDFATMPDRYEAAVSKMLGETTTNIEHPSARAFFAEKHKVSVAQGLERIKDLSRAKERDFERGQINDQLNKIRESGLNGDFMASANAAQQLLESAAALGYYSEEEKSKQLKTFRDSMAVGKLEIMEPEQRTKALNQPWAKNLPSDVRTQLKRDTDKELLATRAMRNVDGYMEKDLDREAVLDEIGKISDSKLRAETERRFEYAYGRKEVAELERYTEIHKEYFVPLLEGEITFDQIPDDQLNQLPADMQLSLYNAQAKAVSQRKVSDINVVDTLNYYEQSKQFKELRKYYLENAHNLTNTDAKAWSEVSMQGVIPPEPKSFLKTQQALVAKLQEIGQHKNMKTRGKLTEQLTDWFYEYQEANGKPPTDKERDAKLDSLLIEHNTGLFGMMSKRRFEMDQADIEKQIEKARERDPELVDDVLKWFEKQGYVPSEAEFFDAYIMMRDANNAP